MSFLHSMLCPSFSANNIYTHKQKKRSSCFTLLFYSFLMMDKNKTNTSLFCFFSKAMIGINLTCLVSFLTVWKSCYKFFFILLSPRKNLIVNLNNLMHLKITYLKQIFLFFFIYILTYFHNHFSLIEGVFTAYIYIGRDTFLSIINNYLYFREQDTCFLHDTKVRVF